MADIPSRFGQLVALASLGREQIAQEGALKREVGKAWQSTFLRWLCLNLREQKADLDDYSEWLGVEVSKTLGKRYLPEPAVLIPEGASAAERLLFLSDTDALFQLVGVRRQKRRAKAKRSSPMPAAGRSRSPKT